MNPYLKLAIALAIYVAVGHKILRKAFRNIKNGQIFDENFLMVVATFGSLAMGEYEEAIMVMVLYRIGEYFQDKAVAKSRRSIADL
ncbi:MAG: heavy metal translocating P-type ATPase, partial [Firmicutes bacterium]|nr:heavy metal translocating P-type ATPase [Bacillota bacterium]